MTMRPFIALLIACSLGMVACAADRPSTATRGVQVLAPPMRIASLDRQRSIRVYLPPSYGKGHRRYPVLYMHDGQNLFDDATSFTGEWGVDEALDALAKSDGIEVIVVGIDNGGDKRINELSPWPNPRFGAAEGRQYMDFVVGTLKPAIDRRFRTRPGPEDTGIMGSSLGAIASHYAIYQYPEVFGKAGIFSPSYWFAPAIFEFTAQHHLRPGARLYMLVGDKEGDEPREAVDNMRKMEAQIRAAGERHLHLSSAVRVGGEHNEAFWKREFPEAMRFLFGRKTP